MIRRQRALKRYSPYMTVTSESKPVDNAMRLMSRIPPYGVIWLMDNCRLKNTKTLINNGICPTRIRVAERDPIVAELMIQTGILHGSQIVNMYISDAINTSDFPVAFIYFDTIKNNNDIDEIEKSVQFITSMELSNAIIVCTFNIYEERIGTQKERVVNIVKKYCGEYTPAHMYTGCYKSYIVYRINRSNNIIMPSIISMQFGVNDIIDNMQDLQL